MKWLLYPSFYTTNQLSPTHRPHSILSYPSRTLYFGTKFERFRNVYFGTEGVEDSSVDTTGTLFSIRLTRRPGALYRTRRADYIRLICTGAATDDEAQWLFCPWWSAAAASPPIDRRPGPAQALSRSACGSAGAAPAAQAPVPVVETHACVLALLAVCGFCTCSAETRPLLLSLAIAIISVARCHPACACVLPGHCTGTAPACARVNRLLLSSFCCMKCYLTAASACTIMHAWPACQLPAAVLADEACREGTPPPPRASLRLRACRSLPPYSSDECPRPAGVPDPFGFCIAYTPHHPPLKEMDGRMQPVTYGPSLSSLSTIKEFGPVGSWWPVMLHALFHRTGRGRLVKKHAATPIRPSSVEPPANRTIRRVAAIAFFRMEKGTSEPSLLGACLSNF
jgi:hypothetical protein